MPGRRGHLPSLIGDSPLVPARQPGACPRSFVCLLRHQERAGDSSVGIASASV